MLEPPDVNHDTILGQLSAQFGITATALEFIPSGEDSSAWAYRAETADGSAYVLKLRRGQVNQAGLTIPRYLQEQGLPHIVAPVPGRNGALSVTANDFAWMVYPFVAGSSAHEAGMSEAQWIEYGSALRQIHGTTLSSHLLDTVRRESYVPKATQLIMELDAHIGMRQFSDQVEETLVAVWRARRGQIRELADRAGALGLRLRQKHPPEVLCHADIHTANVLLDAAGQLWIVDWDEVMLAPKERDLMFVVGGLGSEWVNPQQTTWFFRGYGRVMVDPLALAFYRYDWAVQDIAEYAARVMLRPELGTESKRSALGLFMKQFDRGGMVDVAESSRLV
jgi:spectinomycin phosphotransferase